MHCVDACALRRDGQIRDEGGVTLRVEGPVMRLQGPGEDRLLVTEAVRGARFYAARIEGIAGARMAGRGWEWDGGYTLRPHLSCDFRPRDWAWAWTPTYGPVILNIYLSRTVAEWEEWLAAMEPHGYQRGAKAGEYRWGDSRLTVRPDTVQFLRGYHTPPAAVRWVDAGLLCSLLSHELAWDLIDGDYRVWMATGHTAASLANHVRADAREERGNLPWHTVEAGTLRDDAAIAEAIATSFGLAAATDILAWFRETQAAALPRTIVVTLPRDLVQMYETSVLLQGLVLANPRVFWSFRFGG